LGASLDKGLTVCDEFLSACANENGVANLGELQAATTDPPAQSSGIAIDEPVGWDVVRDHGTGSDHCIMADGDGQQRTVRSNAATRTQQGRRELCQAAAPMPKIIGKRDTWPDVNFVFYNHTVPKIDSALDGHPISDAHGTLNESVVTDIAIRAHNRARCEVCERPYASARPNLYALVNKCVGMNKSGRCVSGFFGDAHGIFLQWP
jgi:hypothetical protein